MFAVISDSIIFTLGSLTILMVLRIVLRSRPVRRGRAHMIMACVIYIICGMMISRLLVDHVIIKSLATIALSVAIAMYIYDVRIYMSLIAVLAAMLVEAATDAVSLLFLKFCINDINDMTTQDEMTGRYIVMVCYTIIFLLILIVRRLAAKKTDEEANSTEGKYVILFSIYSMLVVIGYIDIFSGLSDDRSRYILCIMVVGLLLMEGLLYMMLNSISEKNRLIRERDRILIQEEGRIEKNRIMYDALESQRRLIHDHKSHMECIRLLIHDGEYDSLRKYIDDLYSSDKLDYNRRFHTNNIYVDEVLNSKYTDISKEAIAFSADIGDMSELWLDSMEVVSLISNLMDNAIEACMADGVRRRFIKISLSADRDRFAMDISNSYTGTVRQTDESIETSKEYEQGLHGVGIGTVRYIVDKYGGDMNISTDNGIFRVQILLRRLQ